MTESAARESLPAAVASVFDAVAASSAAGAGSAQSGIRTPEDWATLLSALSTAGLLPQTELLSASRDLALPATYAQLHRRLNNAHDPPRAEKLDGLLDNAVARVRHLHGLVAEWDLASLSADQSARLVAMLEALRTRIAASVGQLRNWHDGIHATLGPERCQTLVWDLLEPASAEAASAHAFQRENVGAIERRCAQLRVRGAMLPPDASTPTPRSQHDAAARAAIDVLIGDAIDERSFKVRVVRCPHAGVSYSETAVLLAAMDATRQLSLSRHAPAFLGHEPCVPASSHYPAHAVWYLELLDAPTVAEGLLEGGALPESSLLFRHWRRELLEALAHLSAHTTFLLSQSITLAHVYAADGGCRLVLDGLAWGAEFPEHEPGEWGEREGGERRAADSSATQAGLDPPLDHQALRDAVLL